VARVHSPRHGSVEQNNLIKKRGDSQVCILNVLEIVGQPCRILFDILEGRLHSPAEQLCVNDPLPTAGCAQLPSEAPGRAAQISSMRLRSGFSLLGLSGMVAKPSSDYLHMYHFARTSQIKAIGLPDLKLV
jgi:hypothetical protein